MLAAGGVDATGRKHVLGLREGPSENATVAAGLLEEPIGRGLRADRRRLFVIHGAKALRAPLVAPLSRPHGELSFPRRTDGTMRDGRSAV